MKFWILIVLSLISVQARAGHDEREINIFADPELGFFVNDILQDYSRNKFIVMSAYYDYNEENLLDPDQNSWILITTNKDLVKSLEAKNSILKEDFILVNPLALYTKENNELLCDIDEETDFSKVLETIKTGSKLLVADKNSRLGLLTANYLKSNKLGLKIEYSTDPPLLLAKEVIERNIYGINFSSAVNNNKYAEILATIDSQDLDGLTYQVVMSVSKGIDEAKFLINYITSEKAKLLLEKHGLRTEIL